MAHAVVAEGFMVCVNNIHYMFRNESVLVHCLILSELLDSALLYLVPNEAVYYFFEGIIAVLTLPTIQPGLEQTPFLFIAPNAKYTTQQENPLTQTFRSAVIGAIVKLELVAY